MIRLSFRIWTYLIVTINLVYGSSQLKDEFVVSYYSIPEYLSSWIVKNETLITGNSEIDNLNKIYSVNDFEFVFTDTTPPFNRHFRFLRGDTSGTMDLIVSAYEAASQIESAHVNTIGVACSTPNDPTLTYPHMGQSGINLLRGWDLATSLPNGIGMIDLGCDYSLNQLSSSVIINAGEDYNGDGQLTAVDSNGVDDDSNGLIDDFFGWNFESGNNNIPASSHGTHVASILCSKTNDSLLVSGIAGGWSTTTAPTPLIICRAPNITHMLNAVQYLCSRDIQVINISMDYGALPLDDLEEWQDLVSECIEPNEVNIVGGAGNNGNTNVVAPARAADVISVAALDLDSRDWIPASFTNYGSLVDIAAPGVDWDVVNTNSSTTQVQGTSFSAPVISATIALMLSIDPTLTRTEVMDLLSDNATSLSPGYGMGAGIVQVYKTLSATKSPPAPSISITGYSNGHPVLGISGAEADVTDIQVYRKIVTNDKFKNVIEDWTLIGSSTTTDEYTDYGFGHSENGPYKATYRVKYQDYSGLISSYSNQVSTEGYIGMSKLAVVNSIASIHYPMVLPAMAVQDEFIYLTDWFQGLAAIEITDSGMEVHQTHTLQQGVQYTLPLDQNMLYAYRGSDSITVYTLDSPDEPISLSQGFSPTVSNPYYFDVSDQTLFVAGHHPAPGLDLEPVFEVIDYSDLDNIQSLFTFSQTTGFTDILLSTDPQGFAIGVGEKTQVWDVTDPENVHATDTITTSELLQLEPWGDWIIGIDNEGTSFWSLNIDGQLEPSNIIGEELFQSKQFSLLSGGSTCLTTSDEDSLYCYVLSEDNEPLLAKSLNIPGIISLANSDEFIVAATSDSLYLFTVTELASVSPPGGLISSPRLSASYPNPFNPSTAIDYVLPLTADIQITVFDILGRNVWSYQESSKPAGSYTLKWTGLNQEGRQVPGGVYLISFVTSDFRAVRKAVLIR